LICEINILVLKSVLKLAGILLSLCGTVVSVAQAQFPSVTYKFKVKENGIYSIGYGDLKNAGINPDNITPANITLLAYPTGMLPQANKTEVPLTRQPVRITVTGQEDGKFDKDDRIIFYGQGPDKQEYRSSKKLFAYGNNVYSDENYYFLLVNNSAGPRIASSTFQPGTNSVISEYTDFGYYETDQYNDLKSGREWFGEQFDVKNEITIRFEMPGIVPNTPVRFVSNLMTQSYEYSYFKIFWNNASVLEKRMDTIPQTVYGPKGWIGVDTLTLNSNTLNAATATNQDIKINFTKGGGNRSVGYLNYILFGVTRKASMYKDVNFMTIPKQPETQSDLEIANLKQDAKVWDVTDPFNVVELLKAGTKAALNTSADRHLAVFVEDGLKTPEFAGIVEGNLVASTTPSLVIVTHPDFLSEAERLAAHRRSVYGITVGVFTTQQIYDDFSGGRQDVTAIRNFLRHLNKTSPGTLKNLLLFGRGSYDYKSRIFNNTNFVPIYESRVSLEPLETYSSDDYFGFLEDNEGEWIEQYGKDHTLDIGVGRLPVTSVDEASTVVDKLISYDKNSEMSSWRQRILFVADDGDWNIHQSQAEDLAEAFEQLYKNYHTSKLYLDAFEQESVAAGQISPKAKEALRLELNKGYEIINYTGHGSERVWMQERILDQDTPMKLKNGARLPLFLTATCEFGRHDDPLLKSTAEMLLLQDGGGAIGLVTTARPVNTITNSVLNRAFYAAYFEETSTVKDLGSIFRQTKNQSLSGVANRNFSLLGDPSMRFEPPRHEVVPTLVKTSDGSEVLKSLSKVTVMGEVRVNGTINTGFDGIVEVELFDRRSQLTTLGDENAPFGYKLWDHSLFRGKGRVVDGEFAVEFVLPVGVSSEIQNGKLTFYAYTSDRKHEAQGTMQNIKVGGIDPSPVADVTGPSVNLFIGDTTFVDGGYANANTFLVGKLSDKNGINISGFGTGNLIGTLDGTTTFNVNDYYIANADDNSNGYFSYPLNELEEGQHTITFTATDTYGNPGTGNVTFIVGPDGKLIIEELIGYPNPFSESTPATIEFRHNRAGEDLEVSVAIYDVLGQLADKRDFTVASSNYKVTLFDWNGLSPGGTKMGNGIYFVKLAIRSVSDGAKNAKIAKLILTN
jgi:Peptidase family C25